MASNQVQEILRNLNSEQLEAVTASDHPLIIIAGAGSGKTRVLTRRIAYRIATGDANARHTLAVTFTKKAATEVKQRIQSLNLREQIEARYIDSRIVLKTVSVSSSLSWALSAISASSA